MYLSTKNEKTIQSELNLPLDKIKTALEIDRNQHSKATAINHIASSNYTINSLS